jgi:hypothetical protein
VNSFVSYSPVLRISGRGRLEGRMGSWVLLAGGGHAGCRAEIIFVCSLLDCFHDNDKVSSRDNPLAPWRQIIPGGSFD